MKLPSIKIVITGGGRVSKGAMEVFEENMGDDLFKRTYESAMKSMRASSGWISKSAGAYMTQRDRVMGG